MGIVKNLISISLWPLCEVTISDETSRLCVLALTTGVAAAVEVLDNDVGGGSEDADSPLQLLLAGSGRVSDGEKQRRPTSHTLPTGSQHAHWHVDTSSKLTALMSADSRIVSKGGRRRCCAASSTTGNGGSDDGSGAGGGDEAEEDVDSDDGGRSCEAAATMAASGWTAAAAGTGFRSFFLRFRGLIMRGRLFSDAAPPELSSLPPSGAVFLPPHPPFVCSVNVFFAFFLAPLPPPAALLQLYLAACIRGTPCLCAAKFAFSTCSWPPPWFWWWWCQYAVRPYQSCNCW